MKKLRNEELDRLTTDEFKQAEKYPIVVVLDNIRSLNNIGSIFRTGDAFRIKEVHLCGITATPPHREINKTALGATETVDWKYFKNTLESIMELREKGYKIFSIEQTEGSIGLDKFYPAASEKLALVFGHEVHGVAQQVVDASHQCIEIPQFGTKHSLNVSVSAGIVLWDIFSKIRK